MCFILHLLLSLVFTKSISAQSDTLENKSGKKTAEIKTNDCRININIVSMSIDTSSGTLSWTTIYEKDTTHYVIEELRWGKFYRLAEVAGKGKKDSNHYSVHVPTDSCLYQLRVRSHDGTGSKGKMITVPVSSDAESTVVCSWGHLPLTKITRFEIMDQFGKMRVCGYSNNIVMDTFPSGVYYLNYANKTTEFICKSRKK